MATGGVYAVSSPARYLTGSWCQSKHHIGLTFGYCGLIWCSPSKALELVCGDGKKGLMFLLLLKVTATFCFAYGNEPWVYLCRVKSTFYLIYGFLITKTLCKSALMRGHVVFASSRWLPSTFPVLPGRIAAFSVQLIVALVLADCKSGYAS